MLPDGLGLGPTLLFRRDRWHIMAMKLIDRRTGCAAVSSSLIAKWHWDGALKSSSFGRKRWFTAQVRGPEIGRLSSAGRRTFGQQRAVAQCRQADGPDFYAGADCVVWNRHDAVCRARDGYLWDGLLPDVTQSMTRLTIERCGQDAVWCRYMRSKPMKLARALGRGHPAVWQAYQSLLSLLQVAVKDRFLPV